MTHRNLLWLDLETTGFDPNAHDILEVGWCITDRRGEEVTPVKSKAVWVTRPGWRLGADDDAWKMHEESGLIAEVTMGKPLLSDVLDEITMDIEEFCCVDLAMPTLTPILAGNSVHFDRAFLRAKASDFEEHALHYRNLDVRSLLIAAEAAGMDVPDVEKAHRAGPDVRESIRLYRWWLEEVAR